MQCVQRLVEGQRKSLVSPKRVCLRTTGTWQRAKPRCGGLRAGFSLFPARLARCEKALAEYLETKRLAFPRFYFVSSADLLDILSNGNEPAEVGAGCEAWTRVLCLSHAAS